MFCFENFLFPLLRCTEPEKLTDPAKGELKREEKKQPILTSIEYAQKPSILKTVKLNPLEIAKQNSAKLELKKQEELRYQQKNKTLKSPVNNHPQMNRLSSTNGSSVSQESDVNQDLAFEVMDQVENIGHRNGNGKRKVNDFSDDSLFENDASREPLRKQKVVKKKKQIHRKNSSDSEDDDDSDFRIAAPKKLNKPAVRVITQPDQVNKFFILCLH